MPMQTHTGARCTPCRCGYCLFQEASLGKLHNVYRGWGSGCCYGREHLLRRRWEVLFSECCASLPWPLHHPLPLSCMVAANTGNYVILPSPRAISFVRQWAETGRHWTRTIRGTQFAMDDQAGLNATQYRTHNKSHIFCRQQKECLALGKDSGNHSALIRRYIHSYIAQGQKMSFFGNLDLVKKTHLDPCHPHSKHSASTMCCT